MVVSLFLLLLSLHLEPAEAIENSCQRTLEDLREIFQEVIGENYTVVINCISFDQNGAMDTAIVSGVSTVEPDVRYLFECINGVPVAFLSSRAASSMENASGCLGECVDVDPPCNQCEFG